jgi:opacity protein-like surface antigen
MRHTALLVAFAFVLSASPARAQDPDKPVTVEIGAGYTWSLSDVREVLGDGFNFNIGVTWEASPLIGIEGLYSFNGLGEKDFTFPVTFPVSATPVDPGVPTPFTADMNMQYGTAALVIKSPTRARIRPYGLTGVGLYYRPITVTTPGVGYVPGFCSPWYYYCVPGGLVPVDNVVGDRSSTDFGMVFGAGVNIAASEAASVYVEFRYHYIWGPEINPTAAETITGSTSTKANGQFLPFTVGIRF